jgi:voltage-gated potassium channel
VRRKSRYLFSFYGIVDLLAILPAYLSIFLGGAQYLMVTRVLRMLRVFRILKMPRHLAEADFLLRALQASKAKIAVFIGAVLVLIILEATLMYLIEGGVEGTGFTSIPQSIYWAIVTFTTVGYGDIAPVTVAGKILASIVMLTGYSIIAVPTGIISAEVFNQQKAQSDNARICPACGRRGHENDASFCLQCGQKLEAPKSVSEPQYSLRSITVAIDRSGTGSLGSPLRTHEPVSDAGFGDDEPVAVVGAQFAAHRGEVDPKVVVGGSAGGSPDLAE